MMYGFFGGCTTLLHLFARQPVLLLALGLSGLAAQVPSNPGPGDRYGTAGSLAQLEHRLITEHPELVTQSVALRTQFDRLNIEPTEDQIRLVLNKTDACTDISMQSLNPDERREAAWILYLDKHGPLK